MSQSLESSAIFSYWYNIVIVDTIPTCHLHSDVITKWYACTVLWLCFQVVHTYHRT